MVDDPQSKPPEPCGNDLPQPSEKPESLPNVVKPLSFKED